jgi:antitoxin (DNA-binding transcriptional repressor) of toxin-antitoxin stability system
MHRAVARPLPEPMYHDNVSPMRITTIRELKHDTTTVLSWVAGGETVEVRRRNEPVALLSPPRRHFRRPDFGARLKAIYGKKTLATTGTELISTSRGNS